MKSKLIKINDKQTSCRVHLPRGVQEILNVNVGDYIEWIPTVDDGNIIFTVKKFEEKND